MFVGELSTTHRYADDTTLMAESEEVIEPRSPTLYTDALLSEPTNFLVIHYSSIRKLIHLLNSWKDNQIRTVSLESHIILIPYIISM